MASKKEAPTKEGNSGMIALQMEDVTKRFEHTGRTLFKDISLSFFHGAKIGILGANGAGKSSLLKIMAGVETQIEGKCTPMGGRHRGYLEQEPVMEEDKSVRDTILEGVKEKKALLDRYEAISHEFADPDMTDDTMNALIEEQGALQLEIDDKRLWDLDMRIDVAMDALRCPESDRNVTTLSGGEKRRVALARLLLSEPDILLLDEPTNHLDAGSVAWLERFLDDYPGLVVAITHDRYFLDNVAGYILEISEGRCIPFKGNYGDWLESKAGRLNLEDKKNRAENKVIKRELEWLRGNSKNSKGKNKSRKGKAEALIGNQQASSLPLHLLIPLPRTLLHPFKHILSLGALHLHSLY
jgi:ATPase subunit of ABC transporter with duplicated ATPase domains